MKTLRIPGQFQRASFSVRVNRFVAQVEIAEKIYSAHVPTSGRLIELLVPGAEVMVRKAQTSGRKTQWDLMLVSTGDTWVSLDSRLPNYLVGQLLHTDKLPPFLGAKDIKAEQAHGSSRLDFAFTDINGQRTLMEVKSVTLVEEGIAKFPDAPTIRGARHLRELARSVGQGYRAAIIFIIQRDDAESFAPNTATDPDFARALKEADAAGVEIYAWRCRVEANALTLMDERVSIKT